MFYPSLHKYCKGISLLDALPATFLHCTNATHFSTNILLSLTPVVSRESVELTPDFKK